MILPKISIVKKTFSSVDMDFMGSNPLIVGLSFILGHSPSLTSGGWLVSMSQVKWELAIRWLGTPL